MSKGETIAKLESLLARIRARAAEPRRPAPVVAMAAPVAAPAALHIEEVVATSARPSVDDETTLTQPTRPPPAPEPDVADVADVIDVDVQEATSETVIGVPAEEAPVAEAFESRERLVAAEPVAEMTTVEAPAAVAPPVEEPPQEVLAAVEEAPQELLAAEEDVEDAPLSSRRPVAPQPEERIAEIAFGAEEPRPPRHTPPPESGRLPAAPVVEFDADVTGVHETPAAVGAPHRAEREPEPEMPRRASELVPETTAPDLPSGESVVDVVGEAQAFAPSTFVALLDASLAL